MLYPMTFAPVYKDYPWGGAGFRRIYGREVPFDICAESWEITDRPDGMSVVLNGPLAGTSLHDLLAQHATDLAGTAWHGGPFPLLVKLIDARERLSLQVHPDEQGARACGGDPKTEAWLMLDTMPDARVFTGLKPGVTKSAFQKALAAQRLEELLVALPAHAGDVIFIPGGRLHAIDAGCLLLEVQQNSNTTYRVFDWNRMGKDGRPRPLHRQEAFDVIDWQDHGPGQPRANTGTGPIRELLACPYFTIEQLVPGDLMQVVLPGHTCHILFVMEGQMEIVVASQTWTAARGTTWLIPAGLGGYSLRAAARSKAARISLPAPAAR